MYVIKHREKILTKVTTHTLDTTEKNHALKYVVPTEDDHHFECRVKITFSLHSTEKQWTLVS